MTASSAVKALVLTIVPVTLATAAVAGGDPGRGAAIFALAGGCGCHTPENGPVGAGGAAVPTPFGTFYGTNITPDPDTGLGGWSDDEIVTAIREGYARGKGVEAPVMPYYLFAGMSDEDVRNLVAYLRTLSPVRRENRPADVNLPIARVAYRAWRYLFAPRPSPPAHAPDDPVERGRYLADHVSICTDCHTPRNWLGAPRRDMYLAGTENGPHDKPVPNITPHRETGIGKWDAHDITQVLRRGMLPNFDNVQGLMADVVDGVAGGPGYSRAPEGDLRAISQYLLTVEPVENAVSE